MTNKLKLTKTQMRMLIDHNIPTQNIDEDILINKSNDLISWYNRFCDKTSNNCNIYLNYLSKEDIVNAVIKHKKMIRDEAVREGSDPVSFGEIFVRMLKQENQTRV